MNARRGNILIVDDTLPNLRLLRAMLTKQGYTTRGAPNGIMALEAARAIPSDLILLDINMPGMTGYEVCQALKADERTQEVPVIFLSAVHETQNKVAAFAAGGVDYITKPFQAEEVLVRVENQLALRRLQQQLKQANLERERLITELEARNAELERFNYTVSHELKTPLVTIKAFLGLLKQDAAAGDSKRMNQSIQHIHTATERMCQLLRELLALARIGRVVNLPEEVALGALAREAVDLVAGRITERGVQVKIASALPTVCGDRLRLLEVFQNLIENAITATGDQPEPHIEIGVRKDGQQTVCYVRDNGIGIDPRYHEKIFGLFQTLEANSIGTGIGLALVKRIVEVHGGQIWVESEGKGQGSTFCFTLPGEPAPTFS